MNGLLSHEGAICRAVDLYWTAVRLSLVWWAASIPIVTSPAATIWLVHAVRREMRGEGSPGPRSSIALIGELWGQAYRLTAVILAAALLILAAAVAPSPPGLLSQVLIASVVCAGALWCLVVPCSVVVLERRRAGMRDALAVAYVHGMRKPMRAAGAAVGITACLSGVLFAPAPIRLLIIISAPACAAALAVKTADEASLVEPDRSKHRRVSP